MKRLLIAAAALLYPCTAAVAEDTAKSDDRRVRVGLGVQLQPEYIGADKTERVSVLRRP